jgi:hypothetical protein
MDCITSYLIYLLIILRGIPTMAESWEEVLKIAREEGKEQVFHDFDKKTYDTCMKHERPGHFSSGCYIEHRCICISRFFEPERTGTERTRVLSVNPDWLTS